MLIRSLSAAAGVGSRLSAIGSVSPKPLPFRPLAFSRDLRARNVSASGRCVNSALGAGNSGDEDPIAAVRGAEGSSGKAVPFRVVPALGQASEYLAKECSALERKEVCDVLHEHVAGSYSANDAERLSPKRSLGMPEALSLAGGRDALAGEAEGHEVDSGKPGRLEGSHVGVDGDAGVAEPEDSPSELVELAEEGVLESGEAESVGHEPAAVEESADSHVTLVHLSATTETAASSQPPPRVPGNALPTGLSWKGWSYGKG